MRKTNLKSLVTPAIMTGLLAMAACGGGKEQPAPPPSTETTDEGPSLPKETKEFVGSPDEDDETVEMIEQFDSLYRHFADNKYVNGLVVAAVTPDAVAVRGYGNLADEADPGALNFQFASVTKVFTGMAMASMVNDKVITPDTPLDDCLPEQYRTAKTAALTLRQLASHTAGLPMDMPGVINPSQEFYSNVTTDQLFASLANAKYSKANKYVYSNYSFALLGAALAQCDGVADWKTLIEKRVTTPLGVPGISVNSTPVAGYDNNLSQVDPWSWESADAGGHAALRGNANDLARVAQMMMAKGNFYGHNMLTTAKSVIYEMSSKEASSNQQYAMGYGIPIGFDLHWDEDDLMEYFRSYYWQSGSSITHSTMFFVSPENQNAIIIFSNDESGETLFMPVIGTIMAQYGYDAKDITKSFMLDYPARIELTSEQKNRLVGKYVYGGDYIIEIVLRGASDEEIWAILDFEGDIDEYRLFATAPNTLNDHGKDFDDFVFGLPADGGSATKITIEDWGTFNRVVDSNTDSNSDADDSDGNSDGNSDSGSEQVLPKLFKKNMDPQLKLIDRTKKILKHLLH